MVPHGVTAKMVTLIAERDSYHCARCGKPAPAYRRQIHHRKPRGLGGRKNGQFTKVQPRGNDVDIPENLVLLCGSSATDPDSCHHHVETHRSMALHEGWLVHEWEDPREKLILARDGEWHQLVDDQWDPMLLPVTVVQPRPTRWARGPERDARRPDWQAVHRRDGEVKIKPPSEAMLIEARNDTSAVRAWAKAAGCPVGERGKLPMAVFVAYEAKDPQAARSWYGV